MSFVELVGYAALYVVGAVALIYIGIAVISVLARGQGLAGLAVMALWIGGVAVSAVAVGLLMLGRFYGT